jgi:CRP-like cAMP-binding protein
MTIIELDAGEHRRALQMLANYPLFEGATASSVETIVSAARMFRSPQGARVRLEGTEIMAVHFLLDGCVRVIHEHGRLEFTPKILAAPCHFGDLQAIAGLTTAMQSVEVVTEAIIAEVPWSAIREVLISDHPVCLAWLESFAEQFLLTVDANRHTMFSSLRGRVANVLLSYGEAVGRPASGGVELPVSLSRDQLARHVGSVKRVVIKVMQELAHAGLVDVRGSTMFVRAEELVRETLPRRLGLTQKTSKPRRLQRR